MRDEAFFNRKRPVHLGPYPLERLRRQNPATPIVGDLPPRPWRRKPGPFRCCSCVRDLPRFVRHAAGKGESGEIDGTRQINADLRAAELAVITASFVCHLEFHATAHTPTASDVDIEQVALQAGIVEVRRGRLRAPYLRGGFALSVITTELEMYADGPLAKVACSNRWGPLARRAGGLGKGALERGWVESTATIGRSTWVGVPWKKGTNSRQLDMNGGRVASKQKVALYTPDLLPPGDSIGVPVKLIRTEALDRADRGSPEKSGALAAT